MGARRTEGTGADDGLRLPWSRTNSPLPRRVLRPLQSFLQQEEASGILLLAAAVVALVWANSPWSASYEAFWHTPVRIRVGQWVIDWDLRHLVNDGLMTLFFLVVGLEIKREVLTGELRERRAAALPILAALGGMVVPALLFVAVNVGGSTSGGWGIPMATDIAFALGVLTIATRRAPAGLKPFLLTIAIVDDIGAIVVIAVFYSKGIDPTALAVAGGASVTILALQRLGVTALPAYVVLAFVLWFATYLSGVHPSIAGVVLGFLTPAAPFQRPDAVSRLAHRTADETMDDPDPPDADAHQWLRLAALSRQAVSPLARLERALHPWTSRVVVPLFALANAGVTVSTAELIDVGTSPLGMGVILGLVLGKPVGISLASYVAVRLGMARLPRHVAMRHIVAMGEIAGIGFTVSLFIAELAFGGTPDLTTAKLAVLIASVLAGGVGSLLLRRACKGDAPARSPA
jgi:NhaA family Na+:H+ antiporter